MVQKQIPRTYRNDWNNLSKPNPNRKMRDEIEITKTRKVEVYQVVLTFISLLIVVIVAVSNINSRITALEIKQTENEQFKLEIKEYFNKLNEGQTQILIQLENKENRVNN